MPDLRVGGAHPTLTLWLGHLTGTASLGSPEYSTSVSSSYTVQQGSLKSRDLVSFVFNGHCLSTYCVRDCAAPWLRFKPELNPQQTMTIEVGSIHKGLPRESV